MTNPCCILVQARSKPHPLRSSLKERPARPASPEKSPKKKLFPRSMSSSNEIEDHPPTRTHAQQKYPTCGASVGAKYADQLKAMDGKRARVLPTEGLDPEEADKLLAKQAGRLLSACKNVNLVSSFALSVVLTLDQ